MNLAVLPLRRVVRGAAASAALTGGYGVLSLLGAFGPLPCPTGSAGGSGNESANGTTASGKTAVDSGGATLGEAAENCPTGVDVLLGGAGDVAPQLFYWPLALLGFVVLGCVAAWTGRRFATWTIVLVGVAISVVGALSVGRYFALPTLFLLVAAVALTFEARRGADGSSPSTN